MKFKHIFLCISVVSVIMLAGCKNDNSQNQTNDTNIVDTVTQNTYAQDIIEADGIFTGLADNHSAEIQIDGEANVFQFDEVIIPNISSINENDSVNIKYIKTDQDQLILRSIDIK